MDTAKPLHDIVVVFDLDDTLYAEADYVLSGKKAVAKFVDQLFGEDLTSDIIACEDDFLELICDRLKLASATKTSLLWHYRLHRPEIFLRSGVTEVFHLLREKGLPICVITDGRSVTQRLKIAALGLRLDAAYISEDLGAEKPDMRAFAAVEADWPAAHYVYIGDNIKKDFIAPNARNWITCGLRPDSRHIHKYNIDSGGEQTVHGGNLPKYWANDFAEIEILLLELCANSKQIC